MGALGNLSKSLDKLNKQLSDGKKPLADLIKDAGKDGDMLKHVKVFEKAQAEAKKSLDAIEKLAAKKK